MKCARLLPRGFQFLGERFREPRETPHVHPHSEFWRSVACGNVLASGLPVISFFWHPMQSAGCSVLCLACRAVNLDEYGIVDVVSNASSIALR
jgi:hypothetical protein